MPKLKFDILKCMLTSEPFSQTSIMEKLDRTDSGNISRVWNKLKLNDLIHEIKSGKQLNGYRRRKGLEYYIITAGGAHWVILNSPTEIDFWDSLARYVYYNTESVSMESIFELFNLYISKYLNNFKEYFPFQLDFFNSVYERWIEDSVNKQKNMPIEQKIIESLARKPNSTSQNISDSIKEKLSRTEQTLRICTLTSLTSSTLEQPGNTIYQRDPEEWKYQRHKIVQINSNSKLDEPVTYSLTLFGVLAALSLLSEGMLNKGLFYKSYDYKTYFDLIAKNYASKLPLIFGKWENIKSVLGNLAYSNFSVILNKTEREIAFNTSVIFGGNREFYEGIKTIAEYSRNKIEKFCTSDFAINFFRDSISGKDDSKDAENSLRLKKVFDLASYVKTIAYPAGHFPHNFRLHYANPNLFHLNTFFYAIPYLENCLSHEISSVYFLSLDTEFEPHEYLPEKRYNLIRQAMKQQRGNDLRARLKKICDGNREIAIFLDTRKKEISSYYSDVSKVLTQIPGDCLKENVNISS